uniref:NFATC2-interacting protein n=1 Tax=Crocodylus porosus TaxID=8502 RepID=A0A7M4F1G6_CROPO
MSSTAPLSGLMGRYRAAAGLDTALLRFVFDGRLLPPSDTPEELGLEPGDVIESQTGTMRRLSVHKKKMELLFEA